MHTVIVNVVALAAVTAGTAMAQSKSIPVKTETQTVSVEAIDHATRQLTVKKADGNHDVFHVPESVKRFDAIKVGDRITTRAYENIVLQVKAPGDKQVVDKQSSAAVPAADGRLAGTISHQRTITATIEAIDPAVPSITFTGPRGWKYSSRVKDKEALGKVKVGDKVDITWTEATLLSIEDVK
jgi:hypothetical protein